MSDAVILAHSGIDVIKHILTHLDRDLETHKTLHAGKDY